MLRTLSCCSLALVAACAFEEPRGTRQQAVSVPPAVDFEFDARGNLTRTERAGAVTSVTHDALARPATSVDPLQGVTSMRFDLADALVGVEDPRGVANRYTRDGFGAATAQTRPDPGDTALTFDEAGNLTASRDARGVTSVLQYDALDRLTVRTHQRPLVLADAPLSPDGGADLEGERVDPRGLLAPPSDERFTWAYDDTATGALSGETFPGGAAQYTYDLEGRLTSQTLQAGSGALVTGFEYEADAGHLVALRYPSGRRLDLQWEADVPRALFVTSPGDLAARPVVDEVTLDALDTPASWRFHLEGGATRPYLRSRDLAGRPLSYPVGAATRELSYDARSRVIGYSHSDALGAPLPALDETFTYDDLDRLVGFTRDGVSHVLGYDATGNRTTFDGTTWAIEPASNRLVSRTTDAGTALYALDSAGNTLTDGALIATYAPSGRLASVTHGQVTTTYVHDGSARRVRKLGPLVDVRFVYDPGGRLLGEYDAQGQALREYVWLVGTLVAFFEGNALFFVHTDHLGAPRVAFDTQGRERWRWRSGPFGEEPPEVAVTAGLADVSLPLRFAGQYADAESGLFYNRFRYYQPAEGRYTQADPIGLEGGLNPYAYVSSAPTRAVDPLGLFEMPYERQIPNDASAADLERYDVATHAVTDALGSTAFNAVTMGATGGLGALGSLGRAAWATRPAAVRAAMQRFEAEGFSMGQNFLHRSKIREYYQMSCKARSVAGHDATGMPLVPVVNRTLMDGHHRTIANLLRGGDDWAETAAALRAANYQLPGRMQPWNRTPSAQVRILP